MAKQNHKNLLKADKYVLKLVQSVVNNTAKN